MYSASSLRSQLSFCRVDRFLRGPTPNTIGLRRCPTHNPMFRRTFAQEATTKPPKPKASTPLRRSAAASLPIRSNPTPTRSEIQPIFTLATAERFILPRIAGKIPSGSQVLQEAVWVPKWRDGEKEGEIFIFANGTLVCWGLGEREAEGFATSVLSKANAEISRLAETETEDLEFVTDPTE